MKKYREMCSCDIKRHDISHQGENVSRDIRIKLIQAPISALVFYSALFEQARALLVQVQVKRLWQTIGLPCAAHSQQPALRSQTLDPKLA